MYIDLERCSKAVQQITHKGHRFSVTRGSKIIVCVHITHAITAGPASGQDDGHVCWSPSQFSSFSSTLLTDHFSARKDDGRFVFFFRTSNSVHGYIKCDSIPHVLMLTVP